MPDSTLTLLHVVKDDVNEFINEKIDVHSAAEKNDSQLLKWMDNINETIKTLVVYSEYIPHNGAVFDTFDIDYGKIAALTISKAVIQHQTSGFVCTEKKTIFLSSSRDRSNLS